MMKKFFVKTLLFVLPFVLFAYGTDYLLSGILKKSYTFADGEFPVWNALYGGTVNSDIVVYGTSRALKHINPVLLTDSLKMPAYNLGVNGHSFKSEYFRHKLLLKYNKKPELIIQTLDVTSFEKLSDLYNPDQFLPYMLNNREMEAGIYNGFKHADYVIPMIRYYGKKEAIIEILKLTIAPGLNKPYRMRGYKPVDQSWSNDLIMAQRKLGSFRVISDPDISTLFERYLKECTELKLPIVFVYTPEYIEGQDFVINRAEIMSRYYELSRKYNIPFLDYSNDSICYRKEYFYNTGHLNKTGAEIFTGMLINDLRRNQITSCVLKTPSD